jgi:hypothetical protein
MIHSNLILWRGFGYGVVSELGKCLFAFIRVLFLECLLLKSPYGGLNGMMEFILSSLFTSSPVPFCKADQYKPEFLLTVK